MDIAELKRSRGRLSGLIMGLIASIIGVLFALTTGLDVWVGNQYSQLSNYRDDTSTLIIILLIIISAISIVGASLVRGKRIVGGVILILTGIPLFVISVINTTAFIVFSVTGLACIASGILALIPLSDSYFQKLLIRQQYHGHMEAHIAQRQAEQDNDAISITPIGRSADVQTPSFPSEIEKQDDDTQW